MYPITSAVKALFDAEHHQVIRITGDTVKRLGENVSVYNGDNLVFQTGNGQDLSIYSGSTEVFQSGGTQTIILYSGGDPVYINDSAGLPIHIEITGTNVMMNGFEIDRYCCNGTKLEIGTAIASELTLTLDNRQGQYDGISFEGVELFVEVGIADWTQENPTIHYIPCGYFIPDEQPRKLNTISIKALDRMMKFDVPVDESALTFPATVANLVGQVCTLCGVTLATSLTGLPNASYSVTALPSLQQTIAYRNIIQWCAGVMGTNAWMDWNGQLQFSWYGAATGYGTTTSNRFSSDLYEDDIEITGVQYTNENDATVVVGTSEYALDLTGNYLIEDSPTTILTNINTAINGFTYRPFEASVIPAPYLWPMDAVTFTDKRGNIHSTMLTNVNFGINCTTAIAAKGETAQTNSTVAPSSMTTAQALALKKLDASFDQEEVFNRLTNNGAIQGLYMENNQLYINANYIKSGTLVLGGLNNQNGTLQVLDAYGNNAGVWANDGIIFERYDPEQQWTIHTYICSPFTGTWVPLQVKASSFETTIGVGQIHVTGNTYYNGAGRIRHVYIDNYRILLTDPDVNKSLEISADAPTTLSNLGVKKKTITPTTSSSGGVNVALDPTQYIVLSANSAGYICIPYKASNGTATYCKVLDTSMNPVASTAVSIDITYLDLGANAFS